MPGEAEGLPGLYGKLPARGDFVRRRLPLTFVEPWDGWLQEAIVASRRALGERWLDVYLTSPMWRFALSAGLCGEPAAAGVAIPSVDAVQRCFPLTVATLLPEGANLFQLPAGAHDWFERVETLALSCLDPRADVADLDERLAALGAPALGVPGPSADHAPGRMRWRLDEDALPSLGRFYPRALDDLARAANGPFSLWWTAGSDHVAPGFLLYRGLPPATEFAAFLDERAPLEAAACHLADEAGR